MTDVQTIPVADLEELLAEEIPCGGIRAVAIARSCKRPAVLQKHSHGHPTSYKCIPCWQVWYMHIARRIAEAGSIRCLKCGQTFTSVEAFADYRPF